MCILQLWNVNHMHTLECSYQVVAQDMLVQTVSYNLNDLNLWCALAFRTLKAAPSVTPKYIGQLWVTCFCMCNYITSHVYSIDDWPVLG